MTAARRFHRGICLSVGCGVGGHGLDYPRCGRVWRMPRCCRGICRLGFRRPWPLRPKPSVLNSSIVAPLTPARVSRKRGEREHVGVAGVYLVESFMPICCITSMPYMNENTMPSWAARRRWLLLWRRKLTPCIDEPVSRLQSTRSAPLAEGSMLTPSAPMGSLGGHVVHFGIAYPLGATLRFIHELRMPVPLMQVITPGGALQWCG